MSEKDKSILLTLLGGDHNETVEILKNKIHKGPLLMLKKELKDLEHGLLLSEQIGKNIINLGHKLSDNIEYKDLVTRNSENITQKIKNIEFIKSAIIDLEDIAGKPSIIEDNNCIDGTKITHENLVHLKEIQAETLAQLIERKDINNEYLDIISMGPECVEKYTDLISKNSIIIENINDKLDFIAKSITAVEQILNNTLPKLPPSGPFDKTPEDVLKIEGELLEKQLELCKKTGN